MAITEINSEIQTISGVTSANANFIESAQRFVASSIPKNYMWGYVSKSTPSLTNPIAIGSKTDSVLAVVRGNYHCGEQPQKYRGTVEGNDTNSLYYPTHRHPRYVKDHSNNYNIYPAPIAAADNNDASDHSAGNVHGYVMYVDYSKIDDDSDLRNAVIFYAVSKECGVLGLGKVVNWSSVALPPEIPSPAFGVQLNITTTAPQVPVLAKTQLDTSDWVAPNYVPPTLQLSDFPTITWDFPTSPVAPSIVSNSVEDYSSATPTFIPPPMPSLDFTSAKSYVTNEDPEMVQSQIGLINSQLSEYQNKMSEAQQKFNEENVKYQATIGTFHQEAQLKEGFEGRKLQKFQAEMGKYTQDVNSTIQKNQAEIQAWVQEHGTRVQDFQAKISSAMNEFNKQNVEYQSMVNKSIQNANFNVSSEKDKMASYQAQLGQYQQDTQKEIVTFQQNLAQDQQEYGAKLQKFQADLGKANAEVQQLSSEINSNLAQAQYYDKLADKYYSWATQEVQKFIANNERTTSRAMTAQQLGK